MKFSKKTILVSLFSLAILTLALTPALALDLDEGGYLGIVESEAEYGNPDLANVIGRVIKVILGFLGLILLILFIYAGFLWMTSGGDEEKISTAKKIMGAAVIGLLIIVIAYAITNFIVDRIGEVAEEKCTVDDYKCVDDGTGNTYSTDILLCGTAEEWATIPTTCNAESASNDYCQINAEGTLNSVCAQANP